ncbi:MAG: hypothetical protein JO339_38750 [Alphaproteobacteria bacterium]|nr:hypothetical protein [Alphaproteobacteria bacterium]
MEPEIQASTELSPLNAIRVETALSRYPVHRLARKGSIEISIRESGRRGEVTTWEVDYSKKHGQPGPLAYKLDTLIINRRIEEARRPISRVLRLGSLSHICRELHLADSGKNRSDVKTALFQNAFAGITAKIRYRLGDGSERTLEAAFTRYSVILTGEKLPDGRKADAVYIALNDVFIQVINGAMTRPLDYDYLKSLPPAAQRFYELLSYQIYAALLYQRARAKLVYSELCARAPQTRHTDWDKVRSQMSKIHQPHLQSGYIAKVESEPVMAADGRPDWIFHYQPGPRARAEFRTFAKRGGPSVLEIEPLEPPPRAAAPVSELEIEIELIRRGVAATTARQLVAEHPEEKIRLQDDQLRPSRGKPGAVAKPAVDRELHVIDERRGRPVVDSRQSRSARDERRRSRVEQGVVSRHLPSEVPSRPHFGHRGPSRYAILRRISPSASGEWMARSGISPVEFF